MSRSGYSDNWDFNQWDLIRWRGAVTSAIRGKRGQAFLKEMLASLDALPEKKLVAEELITKDGEVCALGAVGKARGADMNDVDPEDRERIATFFGIPESLAAELMFENDQDFVYWKNKENPEARFTRMRNYIASLIKPEK